MTTATLTRDITFTIDAEALAAAASIAGKVAGTFPGTSTTQLAFKDQRLVLSATDFETSVSFKLPVKGKRAKAVAVPARLLATVTAKLVGAVTITVDDATVNLIDDAGTVYEMPVANETPPLPLAAGDQAGAPEAFDMDAFRKAVAFTAGSVSKDAARPILTAIAFQGGTAVSTDSYRLAFFRDAPNITALVPATAALIAVKAIPEGEDVTVQFSPDKTRMILTSGAVHFGTRLVDGEYPKWQQLVPTKQEHRAEINRKSFLEAVGKIAVADKTVPVRMALIGATLSLLTIVQDVVKADADLIADGTMPNVALNTTYLAAALKVIPSEVITLSATDGLKPVLLTDGSTDSPWKLLLMPVRTP